MGISCRKLKAIKKILIVLLVIPLTLFSQENSNEEKKREENPIIYADLILGPSTELGGTGTLFIGGALNFQSNKDLFSFRYIENANLKTTWFIILPAFVQRSKNIESALLYGKRYIDDNKSYSFSGGISYNKYENYEYNNTFFFTGFPSEQLPTTSETYFGFPFEAEILWFNAEKEPYRIFYNIIPISKPTSFGKSFGFKFVGNISKRSYLGIGLVFGLGFHKQY
jgi:hypothetical protein